MVARLPEFSVSPVDLFEVPPADENRWWAIHTRPRTEKALAKRLDHQSEVGYFLPLYVKRQKYQRRFVETSLPLFPGYLFLRGGDVGRSLAFATNYVVNCLPVENQAQLHQELRQLNALLKSGEMVTPEDALYVGVTAEITEGPLTGYRGKVVRQGSGLRFVLEVNFLQRGTSVEVDSSALKVID